jgi:hypothetical protein
VLLRALHPLADLGDVCEDSLLVAFTEALRGRDLVAPCTGATREVGMLCVKQGEETAQEEIIGDGCGRVVLPDSGAFEHVALLHFGFSWGSGFCAFALLAAGGSQLGFEVVLDLLLLAGLLLLLQCGEFVFSGIVALALGLNLLGRLLFLL